jgi:hypothetical protein
MFSITQPTSTTIAPSGNTNFSSLLLHQYRNKTATISIANNDTDENPMISQYPNGLSNIVANPTFTTNRLVLTLHYPNRNQN